MVTRSDHCPRRAARVQGGEGIVHIKDLTDREGLYGHGKMFSHIVVNPGWNGGTGPSRRHLRHRVRPAPRPGKPGQGAGGTDRPDCDGVKKSGSAALFLLSCGAWKPSGFVQAT